MGDPVRQVRRLLLEIEALPDASERARLATDLLRAWPELHTTLADIRQQAVITMNGEGMSFPAIGAALGLDRTQAWKIAQGARGRSRRPGDDDAPSAGG